MDIRLLNPGLRTVKRSKALTKARVCSISSLPLYSIFVFRIRVIRPGIIHSVFDRALKSFREFEDIENRKKVNQCWTRWQ